MTVSTIVTGQFVRISQTPASIGERFLAFLIDTVAIILYWISLAIILNQLRFNATSDIRYIVLFVLYAAPLFYSLLLEVFNEGQTLGKWIMGTRVVKTDGSTPAISAYLLRWLLFPVDFMFSGAIGVVSILVTRNNQRLGDLAAGTLVIKEKNYKKIQVSLDEFDFLTKDYRPIYPQAADLSLEQVNVISKTLSLKQNRMQRIEQLSNKVCSLLSITPAGGSSEAFLQTLLRDYQHYALEEI